MLNTEQLGFARAVIQLDKLVQVILGEAHMRPAAASSAPKDPLVESPLLAPSHDTGLDQAAELATMRAKLGALELAKAEQQAEIKKLRTKVTVQRMQCHPFLLSILRQLGPLNGGAAGLILTAAYVFIFGDMTT